MMNKFIGIFLTFIICQACFANSHYTVYLTTYGANQIDTSTLTKCGKFRAKQIATLLSNADIKAIYSTSELLARTTAFPLSQQQNIPIKHYSYNQLRQFNLHLKIRKESALIVGDNPTISELKYLLTSQSVKDTNPASQVKYHHLDQVTFLSDDIITTKLTLPVSCN